MKGNEDKDNNYNEKKFKKLIIREKSYRKEYFNFYKVFNKKNVRYIHCVFETIIFDGGVFESISFEECSFKDSFFKNINNELLDVHFIGCSFKGCNFVFCSLPGLQIKSSALENVEFKNTNLKDSKFIGNCYSNVKFIDDCNLMNALILETHSSMDISFINEKSYTKLNYGTYIGRFMEEKNKIVSVSIDYTKDEKQLKTSYSFMDFAEQYMRNHVSGKYGICFYESKKAFHKTLRGKNRLKSILADFICGYGEKPLRTFFLSLGIIFIFSLLYAVVGINTSRGLIALKNIEIQGGVGSIVEVMVYSLYFSIVTFSTVGYGDITPCGIIGVVLSIIEIILGILLIGIWTATLVRKMTR